MSPWGKSGSVGAPGGNSRKREKKVKVREKEKIADGGKKNGQASGREGTVSGQRHPTALRSWQGERETAGKKKPVRSTGSRKTTVKAVSKVFSGYGGDRTH